jgi:hypothetical protein
VRAQKFIVPCLAIAAQKAVISEFWENLISVRQADSKGRKPAQAAQKCACSRWRIRARAGRVVGHIELVILRSSKFPE